MANKCPGCGAKHVPKSDFYECGAWIWAGRSVASLECLNLQVARRDERIAELEAEIRRSKTTGEASANEQPRRRRMRE